MVTQATPEAPEKPKGRFIFGKWFPEGTFTPGGTKGKKGKPKPSHARGAGKGRAGSAPPNAPEDEPPAGLDLPGRPSLAKDIGAAIGGLNDLLLALPWTREDALTQPEAERLVYGLDEAQKSNPRIRRYVKAGAQGSGMFALAIACITIALPRLARHGLIPGLRTLSAEEYAEVQRQQQAAYDALARAGTNGTGPVDPRQPPIVEPIFSNSVG